MHSKVLSLCFFFFFILYSFAQNSAGNQITVKSVYSGVVVDKEGIPIVGANIINKSTNAGVITSTEGTFRISASTGNTLEFSYVGFHNQTVLLEENNFLYITLLPMEITINEIAVTALGIKRRERALGYGVSIIDKKSINSNAVNPIKSLQGKVAGLNISGTDGSITGRTKIMIRGASTLNKNNQPLMVVDGIAMNTGTYETNVDYIGNSDDYGDELKNINPADIESVSVLKGAAATALYGSRGLNGALVITTKSGGSQKGFGVTVSQSLGFDWVSSTPDMQKVYGPGAFAGDIKYGEKTEDGSFYKWDTGQFFLNEGNPTLIGAANRNWGPPFDGRDIILYDGTAGKYSPREDGFKDFYDLGFISNTNIAVKGGNENTSFYLSGGYHYAESTLPKNSFSRTSFLFKGNHKINDKIAVGAQVAFAQSDPQNPPPSIGDYYINTSINQMYDSRYYRTKYKGDHGGMASSNYGDAYADVPVKEVWWDIYEKSIKQNELNIRPSLNMDINIISWLDFKAEANANYYNTEKESKILGRGYRNTGTNEDQGGKYEKIKTSNKEENFAGTFTFNKNAGNITLGGFARAEYRQSQTDVIYNYTIGGLITPGLYSISNSRSMPRSGYNITSAKQVFSTVFAFNTDWKDRLYFEVTGRNDWSSSLLYNNGTGHYSYFYPSVSAAWILSETFRKNFPEWITYGKLRVSWAQVGNDAEPYTINPGYGQEKYLQSDGSYIYTETVSPVLYSRSDMLSPERKNAWEIGADWRFLNNRIAIDIALYKENTHNQIMNISLPMESGTTSRLINAGNIENKGIEVALNTIPVKGPNWQWNLDFTYFRNKNKIVSLHPDMQSYISLMGRIGGGNYRIASVAMVGGDYGMLVSDIMPARDDAGNIILEWNADYRTAYPKRSGKAEKIGSMMPDFTASASTGLRYKNLTLRALLNFRFGGYIASYSNRYGLAYGTTENSLRYRDNANGGSSWTSTYSDSYGQTFHDGVIPEGIFTQGTQIKTPAGNKVDVSGMSFREAYENGYVEPVHASDYHFFKNGASYGTVNEDWVHKVNYIALSEISLSYALPKKIVELIKADHASIRIEANNIGYLYNSLPNNLHPESIRGTTTAEFRERGFIPYTTNFMATITVDF